MHWATIDPGLSGTGFAIWNRKGRLLRHGVIYPKKNKPEDPKDLLSAEVLVRFSNFKVKEAYIEYPKKFQGLKGNMVANKGDLVKLAEFIGYLTAYLKANNIQIVKVPVNMWKGQMTKQAVINRIKRLLPKVEAKSHDWDAIGIGLYVKGNF